MKDKLKGYRTSRILFSLGAIALGVIFLIWPSTSLIVLARIVGIILTVGGAVGVINFFVDKNSVYKTFLLVVGICMLVVGIWIIRAPGNLVRLIPIVFGILVLVSGVTNIAETIDLTRSHYSMWWLSLILGIITLLFGVLLITKPAGVASFITQLVGISLIFDGVSDLWIVSRVSKAAKVVKDAVQDAEAVDTDGTFVEEHKDNE